MIYKKLYSIFVVYHRKVRKMFQKCLFKKRCENENMTRNTALKSQILTEYYLKLQGSERKITAIWKGR